MCVIYICFFGRHILSQNSLPLSTLFSIFWTWFTLKWTILIKEPFSKIGKLMLEHQIKANMTRTLNNLEWLHKDNLHKKCLVQRCNMLIGEDAQAVELLIMVLQLLKQPPQRSILIWNVLKIWLPLKNKEAKHMVIFKIW